MGGLRAGWVIILAALLLGGRAVGESAEAESVRGCDRDPASVAVFSVRGTTGALHCRVNALRHEYALRELRLSPALGRAATLHAMDMVRKRYFSHVSRRGTHASQRVRRTGYLRGARSWKIGEVLGYVRADPDAAARLERNFMNSPRHRRILLDAAFDSVGVGVVPRWPVGEHDDPGVTVVLVLGYAMRGT